MSPGLLQRLNSRGIRNHPDRGAHPSWQGLEGWAPLRTTGTRPSRAVDVPDERRATQPQGSSVVADRSAGAVGSVDRVREENDVSIVGSVASGAGG